MRRALLDVNVLIALLDRDHVHHARACQWLSGRRRARWASCPITVNGCVKIMSQAAYANPLPAAAVIERLDRATRHASHEFWPADVSLLDERLIIRSRVLGPRQVTDLYLLSLAVKHSGCFATFDGAIPRSAVAGAGQEHVAVL